MARKKIAIITGDIIHSRTDNKQRWMRILKKILLTQGSSPKQWEIYRGDSFQLETEPKKALQIALLIKASLKELKDIDVRISIGLGHKTYNAAKITESNGTAFVKSGEGFDQLKKQTMTIHSGDADWDEAINIMLSLALLAADNWKPTTSAIMKISLENENSNQQELAIKLKKTQSSISEGLKRGGNEEIKALLKYFEKTIPE
jgi:hypothetical protein